MNNPSKLSENSPRPEKVTFGEDDNIVEMEVHGNDFQSDGEITEDDFDSEDDEEPDLNVLPLFCGLYLGLLIFPLPVLSRSSSKNPFLISIFCMTINVLLTCSSLSSILFLEVLGSGDCEYVCNRERDLDLDLDLLLCFSSRLCLRFLGDRSRD